MERGSVFGGPVAPERYAWAVKVFRLVGAKKEPIKPIYQVSSEEPKMPSDPASICGKVWNGD